MFYQPVILTRESYSVSTGRLRSFAMHWHSDLEIIFCQQGSFCVKLDTQEHVVSHGQTLLVGSAVPHEYHSCPEDNLVTILRVGSVFFGNSSFMEIAKRQFAAPIMEKNAEVLAVCTRIAALCGEAESLENRLELHGCIYRLVSLLLKYLPPASSVSARQSKRLHYILNIQKTLDYVSANYAQDITVEKAAEVAGYEKNAFSRVFKQATDTSFHKYLNTYRIKKACMLLSEDALPVPEIAGQVGFPETKTFYRVFRQITGMTPGEYRRQQKG